MWKSDLLSCRKFSKNILFLFFIQFLVFNLYCKKEEIKKPQVINKNEYFFFVDVSGSMESKGIFTYIRKKFSEFYPLFKEGDTIYLVSFHEKPILELKIESYNPHGSHKGEIELIWKKLKPSGLYTDFQELIAFIHKLMDESNQNFNQYKELYKDQNVEFERKQFIIVLTDGLDDPRKERKKLDLKQYSTEQDVAIVDRYIYYLNFANQKNIQLEEDLKTVSPNVKTVNENDDKGKGYSHSSTSQTFPKQDSISSVKEEIQEIKNNTDNQKHKWTLNNFTNFIANLISNKYFLLGLLILIFLIFLLVLFFRVFIKKQPLKGEIIFYEVGMHPSTGRTVRLDRFDQHSLSIGSDSSCLIRIKTTNFPSKIILKQKNRNGLYFFKVPFKFLNSIEFLVQKSPKIIQPGDKFKINNYIFEYGYVNKKS